MRKGRCATARKPRIGLGEWGAECYILLQRKAAIFLFSIFGYLIETPITTVLFRCKLPNQWLRMESH